MTILIATLLTITQPNSHLTPGKVLPVTREQVCTPGYSKRVRHVTANMKLRVCRSYGLPDCKGYTVDHLVPLEIGGSNDIANLWPEPITGAKEKDKLENKYRKLVCSGEVSLHKAQQFFMGEH